jgi:hypothetical protein
VLSVTFTPTVTGTRTGTVQIEDDATGSPQLVALTGTGTLPVTVSPTALAFGSQKVGTTGAAKTTTFSNPNVVAVTLASVDVSGDFAAIADTCPRAPESLAAGASCTVSVTFTPTATGTRTGSILFTDDATGSPQKVTLTGTGTLPLTVSPTSLAFGNQTVGSTSTPKAVTLSNTNLQALTIDSIVPSAEFTATSTCPIGPATLGPGASCVVSVRFAPATAGSHTGSLIITSSATGSPQKVTLTGNGT